MMDREALGKAAYVAYRGWSDNVFGTFHRYEWVDLAERDREMWRLVAEGVAKALLPNPWRGRPILCVDFDGVIHQHVSPWVDAVTIQDPPVEGAFAFLEEMVEAYDVAIFSARNQVPGAVEAMKGWFKQHGLREEALKILSFPIQKVGAVVYLDDRAWPFEGTFPGIKDVAGFVPWNRRRA